jgi:hypothetical protein
MNKKTQYTINGALYGGITGLIINAFKQWSEINDDPSIKFNWKRFFSSGGKFAFIGGASGFVIGAITDYSYSNQKRINTNAYLGNLLGKIQIDKKSTQYMISERKCTHIINYLSSIFQNELAMQPYLSGSIIKGTAIKGNSDFDIVLPFKRDSITIGSMYAFTYKVLNEKFKDSQLIEVRKQNKSTGLVFDLNGTIVKIDVVPFRHSHTKGTSGYLFVKPDTIFEEGSYTKTNIQQQLKVRLSKSQREVIMILKKWKIDNKVPISSYMIQLYVQRSFAENRNRIPKGLSDQVKLVIRYLYDNIKTTQIVSPENTNNIISDIPESDKNLICIKAKHFLEELHYHPNTIRNLITLELPKD